MSGQTDAGDVVTVAYLLTIVSFPIRAIGWLLGEFPRSVVGYRRAQAVIDGHRLDGVRRRDAALVRRGAPCSRSTTSTTPTTRRPRCSTG